MDKNHNKGSFLKLRILIGLILSLVILSCTQKYDETGIFNPQDPNFYADTLTSIAVKNTIVNGLNSIKDEYLYLGTDLNGMDTTAFGEILINFELFNTDSALDSAYIMMPILTDSIFDINASKSFDVLKVNNVWDNSEVSRENLNLTPYSHNNFYTLIDTSAVTNNYIKINLNPDSLTSWFTEDSINNKFNGLYIRSASGDELSPIIKLYSSRRPYSSNWPVIHRFSTDTTLSYDGTTDSVFVVETTNYLSDDFSFVGKESICLDTTETKFKIGGISGEGIVCKIKLDTIPSNATVITGRFEIDHDNSDPTSIDPIYGDIRNSDTENEICIYKVTNSNWIEDITQLEYDTLNVWTYKIEPVDTTTVMVADGIMQEWISDPSTNNGFYITSKNWGQPYGFMIFDSLRIKVSYITLTDSE